MIVGCKDRRVSKKNADVSEGQEKVKEETAASAGCCIEAKGMGGGKGSDIRENGVVFCGPTALGLGCMVWIIKAR